MTLISTTRNAARSEPPASQTIPRSAATEPQELATSTKAETTTDTPRRVDSLQLPSRPGNRVVGPLRPVGYQALVGFDALATNFDQGPSYVRGRVIAAGDRAAALAPTPLEDGNPLMQAEAGVPFSVHLTLPQALFQEGNQPGRTWIPLPPTHDVVREIENVDLKVRIDGGAVMTLPVDLQAPTVAVPVPVDARKSVEFWVEVDGQNPSSRSFTADVIPQEGATARFGGKLGEPPALSTVRAGLALRLEYDIDRLMSQHAPGVGEASGRFVPAWYDIQALVSFDGGAPRELPITLDSNDANFYVVRPSIRVPDDASAVEVWFRSTRSGGRTVHDSMGFQDNYRFTVSD